MKSVVNGEPRAETRAPYVDLQGLDRDALVDVYSGGRRDDSNRRVH